ncbi:MAG: peptide deformylase [Bacillota bacterium]|nr:peptide deformylase [Bacillota bacterium]
MAIRDILLLGNEKLYDGSVEVKKEELDYVKEVVEDLHDTLMNFRKEYGAGRAIASPQIDVFKRIIYMNIDKAIVFINPRLEFIGDEKIEVLDDCMSFPNLKVKVLRYKKCRIYYKDLLWNDCAMDMSDDLSELIQHEYDHLDGILAVQRAIDNKSFVVSLNK